MTLLSFFHLVDTLRAKIDTNIIKSLTKNLFSLKSHTKKAGSIQPENTTLNWFHKFN